MVARLFYSMFLLLSSLKLIVLGENSLGEGVVHSELFRDDVIFDISWPGVLEPDRLTSKNVPGIDEVKLSMEMTANTGEPSVGDEGTVDLLDNYMLGKMSNQLFSEVDYNEEEAVNVKTADNEEYVCIIPQLTNLNVNEDSGDNKDATNSPEELIKSLHSSCTKLMMGYWVYELCHGRHLKQLHEVTKGVPKPNPKPGDALSEYILGVSKSGKDKTESSDSDSAKSGSKLETSGPESIDSSLEWEPEKKVRSMHFNGNDYPYYQVEMGDGTPCDLKKNIPRSVIIYYICNMKAHATGTFLNIEEVTTCKYEAVVALLNLCQNTAYRLKENPVHTVQCYSKDGYPTKPKSLLEQEISMTSIINEEKLSRFPSFTKEMANRMEEGEEGKEEMVGGAKDRKTSLNSAVDPGFLDENFIRSFLSGNTCLKGGAGWWQHEVCYGKYVKQVHEEDGKASKELTLGLWVDEGHRKWFSGAGHRRQSSNHVIHLYMNGDICDITGVERQCQVKFRCSASGRLSQVTIFLEEPTTCNYILTIEAAFLCPLLRETDEVGQFVFPSGGFESPEKNPSSEDFDSMEKNPGRGTESEEKNHPRGGIESMEKNPSRDFDSLEKKEVEDSGEKREGEGRKGGGEEREKKTRVGKKGERSDMEGEKREGYEGVEFYSDAKFGGNGIVKQKDLESEEKDNNNKKEQKL